MMMHVLKLIYPLTFSNNISRNLHFYKIEIFLEIAISQEKIFLDTPLWGATWSSSPQKNMNFIIYYSMPFGLSY